MRFFPFDFVAMIFARRGAHLAAERSPSAARADGARRSVAVPNGEGVASGGAIINSFFLSLQLKFNILHES